MKILITAATAKEIKPFLQLYRKNPEILHPHKADVLISGVGLTSTTYHLMRYLFMSRPGLIIQAGVAGCFDRKIPLASVFAIERDTIADESVLEVENLKTLFDLKLTPHNKFPFKKGWLINPDKTLLKGCGLQVVPGVSVNQITTNRKIIQFYRERFSPVTESMEGAALHYVGMMEHIPFLQLRSLSNYIGERNKEKWNMKEAITNLNAQLIRIIRQL
ncbi:MAG: futalosine hydrolase [Chitinophagaceae bacterium]|nr:futalosine hydrolase [Chitinophagaceae bacterium]